ncbi:hypothetical protein Hanom_Chr09g00769471 [Helianthus anomalus]
MEKIEQQTDKEKAYIRQKLIAQTIKQKIYEAWKEAKGAKRWDPDRECYLDPKGNICVEPSSVDVETLKKSVQERKEQEKLKREREKAKKVDNGIIDTTKEMTAENLRKMADKVLMAKALEVNSKSASSPESSSKVSSSGSNNESGKTDCANTESVCRNCMKEYKVCSTHAYLSIKKIQDLDEKVERTEKIF